jgi:hypothetical protein
VRYLQFLINHKSLLDRKGVWSDIDKLTNKKIPEIEKGIEEKSIKHLRLRDCLLDLEVESDYMSKIVKGG